MQQRRMGAAALEALAAEEGRALEYRVFVQRDERGEAAVEAMVAGWQRYLRELGAKPLKAKVEPPRIDHYVLDTEELGLKVAGRGSLSVAEAKRLRRVDPKTGAEEWAKETCCSDHGWKTRPCVHLEKRRTRFKMMKLREEHAAFAGLKQLETTAIDVGEVAHGSWQGPRKWISVSLEGHDPDALSHFLKACSLLEHLGPLAVPHNAAEDTHACPKPSALGSPCASPAAICVSYPRFVCRHLKAEEGA